MIYQGTQKFARAWTHMGPGVASIGLCSYAMSGLERTFSSFYFYSAFSTSYPSAFGLAKHNGMHTSQEFLLHLSIPCIPSSAFSNYYLSIASSYSKEQLVAYTFHQSLLDAPQPQWGNRKWSRECWKVTEISVYLHAIVADSSRNAVQDLLVGLLLEWQ